MSTRPHAPMEPPQAPNEPDPFGCRSVAERLGRIVEEETKALRANDTRHLSRLIDLKGQGLLELINVGRAYDGRTVNASVRNELLLLKRKLETNQRVLKCHLDAVSELALILAQALSAAEGDGTYTMTNWRSGLEK